MSQTKKKKIKSKQSKDCSRHAVLLPAFKYKFQGEYASIQQKCNKFESLTFPQE